MSSSTPRETSGALPEWSGIQKTDKNMIIDPILQQYQAVIRAALQEHMNLVTSQYMTGYARASRESGIGAAMPMDPPNLSDISDVNPVTTPDQTPATDSNAEVAKGWAMLSNQLQTAGNMLAEELWDKAAVAISKRNQQAFESNKETTDPSKTTPTAAVSLRAGRWV